MSVQLPLGQPLFQISEFHSAPFWYLVVALEPRAFGHYGEEKHMERPDRMRSGHFCGDVWSACKGSTWGDPARRAQGHVRSLGMCAVARRAMMLRVEPHRRNL